MDDELFADIYFRFYEELSSVQLENKYGIFYEINPTDPKKLDDQEHGPTKMIIFNVFQYIDDILKSYRYDRDRIWDQYLLDFPRTHIFVQGVELKDYQQLFEPILERLGQPVRIDNRVYPLKYIMAVLCNQSSFAFPFTFIHNTYSDYQKNKMLSSQEPQKIKFTYEKEYVTLEFEVVFTLRDITNGNPISKIENILTLELDLNKKDLFRELGVFRWKEI